MTSKCPSYGCLPHGTKESNWQGPPEELGEKHVHVLKVWFSSLAPSGNKPLWRKLWQKSFPNLSLDSVNAILQKISAIRSFAKKKEKNKVTGERMPLWVKELVAAMESDTPSLKASLPVKAGLEEAMSPKAGLGRAPLPAEAGLQRQKSRRLSGKQSPPHDAPKAGDAEPGEEEPESPAYTEDVDKISHVSVQSSEALPTQTTQVLSLQSPVKRPAASVKKPAAHRRPAASKPIKKLTKKKDGLHSPSFGALKMTKAKEKAYIQYEKDMKWTLSVNVQAKACADCHKVVDELVAYACTSAGLEKAHMLKKRDELMAANPVGG